MHANTDHQLLSIKILTSQKHKHTHTLMYHTNKFYKIILKAHHAWHTKINICDITSHLYHHSHTDLSAYLPDTNVSAPKETLHLFSSFFLSFFFLGGGGPPACIGSIPPSSPPIHHLSQLFEKNRAGSQWLLSSHQVQRALEQVHRKHIAFLI